MIVDDLLKKEAIARLEFGTHLAAWLNGCELKAGGIYTLNIVFKKNNDGGYVFDNFNLQESDPIT